MVTVPTPLPLPRGVQHVQEDLRPASFPRTIIGHLGTTKKWLPRGQICSLEASTGRWPQLKGKQLANFCDHFDLRVCFLCDTPAPGRGLF